MVQVLIALVWDLASKTLCEKPSNLMHQLDHEPSMRFSKGITGPVPPPKVLLISWMDVPAQDYDMLDLFSGKEAISRVWNLPKINSLNDIIASPCHSPPRLNV